MIPAYSPRVATSQVAYVNNALAKNELSFRGEYHRLFETAVAVASGRRRAVLTSSGTTALAAAYRAAGLGGKRVLAPTLSYVATVNQLLAAGATPVLVDCNRDFQMDLGQAESAFKSGKADAMVVAPLYGDCPNMEWAESMCNRYAVPLVVDAAEAFGAGWGGRPVASYGDVATLSFFANKTITCGEGGAVVADDTHLTDAAFSYVNHATIPGYRHVSADATNARMTNLQAAVGLAQLEELGEVLDEKARVLNAYCGTRLAPAIIYPDSGFAWVVVAALHRDATYRQAAEAAAAGGVEVRPVFRPLHTLPAFRGKWESAGDLANSFLVANRHVILPSGPGLTAEDVERVAEVMGPFLKD